MPLPQVDPDGRIYAQAAGTLAFWNNGIGYDINGSIVITNTLDPSDVYVGGKRINNAGNLVVNNIDPPIVANAGLPANQGATFTGAMPRLVNIVPGANDPYVAGVRVSEASGVHLTTAIPP